MYLYILNSGSAGNCYVFDNGTDTLVVEAGVKFSEVKKIINFDISRITGCLISHEHMDHAAYTKEYLNARINVYASQGTIEALAVKMKIDNYSRTMMNLLEVGHTYTIGAFKVIPFDTKHDCREPLGFLIYHAEMGATLFATDTYYLKYKFQGLNNILIECNYRDDILRNNVQNGYLPSFVMKRTLQSHMSYDTCVSTLQANDLRAVNNIVLIHLSDGNSNAQEFKRGIEEATLKTVHVAEKGMKLKFNKTPF